MAVVGEITATVEQVTKQLEDVKWATPAAAWYDCRRIKYLGSDPPFSKQTSILYQVFSCESFLGGSFGMNKEPQGHVLGLCIVRSSKFNTNLYQVPTITVEKFYRFGQLKQKLWHWNKTEFPGHVFRLPRARSYKFNMNLYLLARITVSKFQEDKLSGTKVMSCGKKALMQKPVSTARQQWQRQQQQCQWQ